MKPTRKSTAYQRCRNRARALLRAKRRYVIRREFPPRAFL